MKKIKRKRLKFQLGLHLWVVWKKLHYLFRPFFVVGFALAALVLILIGAAVFKGIFCLTETQNSIFLSVVTGVTASILVAVVIELANNYRNHCRKEQELAEYYGFLYSLETDKITEMGLSDLSLGEEVTGKCIERVIARPGTPVEEDQLEPLDELQVIWKHLPDLIKLLRHVYETKRSYLTHVELESIDIILNFRFQWIKDHLRTGIFAGVSGNLYNQPDYEFLKNQLPNNLLSEFSPEFKRTLTEVEFNRALDWTMDTIFEDKHAFETAFNDMPVGEQYILDEKDEKPGEINDSSLISRLLDDIRKEIEILEMEAMGMALPGYMIFTARKELRKLKKR